MNEVITIHLGRQSFTISVDAHKQLQRYLQEITKQVGDDHEVIEEVESRMAELLAERHITGDKVVLAKDVNYLKKQLGEPSEFGDGDKVQPTHAAEAPRRRFFRDTDNAMLAGVAAGLAAFFGIPVIAVRLVFVLLTFSGGMGILLYLVLWLLAPEAKTSSERLQMQGLPVTVDTLKDVVDRADVSHAARRAGHVVGGVIGTIVRLLLIIVGVGFIITGLALCAGVIAAVTYGFMHGLQMAGVTVFPVGREEGWGMWCLALVGIVIGLAWIVTGYSMVKRRWAFPGWATAALIAGFVLGSSMGTAIGFDVKSEIAARAGALQHRTIIAEQPFAHVEFRYMNNVEYSFQTDDTYSVEIHSVGSTDTHSLAISEQGDTLIVDASAVDPSQRCDVLCPDGPSNLFVIVHAPSDFSGSVSEDNGISNFAVPPLAPEPDAKPVAPASGN
ncbi:MAG TPA: PspC domain-containing protein [Candidatus Saccharimonadales bacterium]|nr:PspC domain-containing protein [Candidatus Saccharimonadales bacterium]